VSQSRETALENNLSHRAWTSLKYEQLVRTTQRRGLAKFETFRNDPVGYARFALAVSLWGKQQEIARSVRDHKRTIVVSSHGVGKTFACAVLVNWFFDAFKSSVVVSTAPKAGQVKDLLWKEIRRLRRHPPFPDILQLRDPDDAAHYAVGITAARDLTTDVFGSPRAQGFHAEHLLYVLDEAPAVPLAIWNAVDGVVVGGENRVLAVGNPIVTAGPFYQATKSPQWNVIHVSAFEHPNILAGLVGTEEPYPGAVSLEWVWERLADPYWCEHVGTPASPEAREDARMRGAFEFPPGGDDWFVPTPIAESKLLGRFPTTTEDTVWSLAHLETAVTRELAWAATDPLEFGLDVARFGSDSTSLHTRRGPCSLAHETWQKTATTGTVGRVVDRVRSHLGSPAGAAPAAIVRVDSTGLGAGVVDQLAEALAFDERVTVVEVNASDRARDPERFPNARSEAWFVAATRGAEGRLDLTRLEPRDVDSLQSQLTAPKYAYDSAGRRVVEPKKDTKARIGRSPDDADAFNLAYYGGHGGPGLVGAADGLDRRSTWADRRAEGVEGSRWSTGVGGGRRRW